MLFEIGWYHSADFFVCMYLLFPEFVVENSIFFTKKYLFIDYKWIKTKQIVQKYLFILTSKNVVFIMNIYKLVSMKIFKKEEAFIFR